MNSRRTHVPIHLGWQLADGPVSDPYLVDDRACAGESPLPALDEVIRGRIRQRLGERIQELDVSVNDLSVVLRGRCSTFYTKQLAQHAALGVLNDEQLDNRIEVTN